MSVKIHKALFESSIKKQVVYSIAAIFLAFGAGWVIDHANPFSAAWFLGALVFIPAAIYAARFLLVCAMIALGVSIVLGIIAYVLAYPW